MLAVYNQKCSNRSNLVPTYLTQVGTALSRIVSRFQRGVPTVPTSTREACTHTYTCMCVYVDMDGTDGTSLINNHKTKTYIVPTSCLWGWNRLERLEHFLFLLFGGYLMADEVDRANDVVQRHLDTVLTAHKLPHAMADECVECDAPISSERQKATGGTDLCVDCAAADERKRRLYRS